MEFVDTPLKGAYLIRLKKIEDERGYFARSWCCEEFKQHGLKSQMTQMNVGFSPRAGTIRGLHYQLPPHAEAKFVRCTRGSIYDVIVDLRQGSPTIGTWFGHELTPDNGLMIYAPEGFAHGYQTLQDNSEMYYLTSTQFAPAAARGVRFDDPAFGIQWPVPVSLVSKTDREWPAFSSTNFAPRF
jgi:dTDP-4-dehydrorhamnose 3,5-epimerase